MRYSPHEEVQDALWEVAEVASLFCRGMVDAESLADRIKMLNRAAIVFEGPDAWEKLTEAKGMSPLVRGALEEEEVRLRKAFGDGRGAGTPVAGELFKQGFTP
jgi:hypothetical protein